MTYRTEIGAVGEDMACRYLEGKKYHILARNVRMRGGELDIVARAPDKALVFVEVKTMRMREEKRLRPEDQMSAAKLRKFARASSLYAGAHAELINDRRGWRMDLVAIDLFPFEKSFVRHYEHL